MPRAVSALLRGLAFGLGMIAAAVVWADQDDPRLDALFEVLQTTGDPAEARSATQTIWRIWSDSGREDVNHLMAAGIAAMGAGRLEEATGIFDRVIEKAPGFAEGWNKRATVLYLRDELAASVRDIERTLALEPRHFGAISGMGLIFLRRGDDEGALEAFEKVLEVNPTDAGAALRVRLLRQKLESGGI